MGTSEEPESPQLSPQNKPQKFLLDLIDDKFELVKKHIARHDISSDGCWIWNGPLAPSKDRLWDYGLTSFRYLGHDRKIRAHRLSYAFHHGVDPAEFFVCHKCDVPLCINPDHLFLGTATDNMQDCLKKGRMPNQSCAENHSAKLTEEEVLEIVSYLPIRNNKEIARMFNNRITHSAVSLIRRGKSWSAVTGIGR